MNQETKNEANVKQAVPFFAVSDIEESLRYYVNGLGFVMLQEFHKEGHDSWVPQGKLGEGVSICFICKDALAIYREVTSRGIEASRPFVGNGMWVTSLSDPDGYRIQFESYTDVPEETEFLE